MIIKRFKASASLHSSERKDCVLNDHEHGLVQAVAENFDTTVSSQNGNKQFHSLALLMIQPSSKLGKTGKEHSTFNRLKTSDIKDTLIRDVPLAHYSGPKKPSMPPGEVISSH